MSIEYDNYLEQHKANVRKGFEWFQENLPGVIGNIPDVEWHLCFHHDKSKNRT